MIEDKILTITSEPIKTNSSYGNWFIRVTRITDNNRQYNDNKYFYRKNEALNFIQSFNKGL